MLVFLLYPILKLSQHTNTLPLELKKGIRLGEFILYLLATACWCLQGSPLGKPVIPTLHVHTCPFRSVYYIFSVAMLALNYVYWCYLYNILPILVVSPNMYQLSYCFDMESCFRFLDLLFRTSSVFAYTIFYY